MKKNQIFIVSFLIQLIIGCEESNTTTPKAIYKADFYVAPDGDDKNPGTIDQPWATWQKAFRTASAGDTVYIRGGTYYPTNEQFGVNISNRNGTADAPICIFNYPDERPVFDFSNLSHSSRRFGIKMNECENWHIKGLEIINVKQPVSGTCGGLIAYYIDGVIFENISVHNIGGSGISIDYSSGRNIIKNCDSYDNYDPYSPKPGGNADGFVLYDNSSTSYIIISGCRSWNNSDDGFDCWGNEGIVIFDSCWSFSNGYDEGQGDGFKMGATNNEAMEETQRIIRHCIAYNNKYSGFDQNMAKVKMKFFNNIAYFNKRRGFELCSGNSIFEEIILRNNISYKNGPPENCIESNAIHDHNNWNIGVTVNDNDFFLLNGSELQRERQSNNTLPSIGFLRIANGSDLIDAGIDVGLPFYGNAPDLGPFEKE